MRQKPTIYTLAHGIEVVGEYEPRGLNRYVRVRIRPHPFFADLKPVAGGCYTRRSRAVMAAKLGRALMPSEQVHHRDEDRSNDAPENLLLISAPEHNKHHKTGSRHTSEAKRRIGAALKLAYKTGQRKRPVITSRNAKGQIQCSS